MDNLEQKWPLCWVSYLISSCRSCCYYTIVVRRAQWWKSYKISLVIEWMNKGGIFHFCQNGTFKPVHEIRNFFWPKTFKHMAIRKIFYNLSQGLPNPGLMQEKVQKGDFLKKPSQELKFFCCFRFLWISQRPGMLNWKRLVFLLSKILYKKCEK